MQSSCASYGNAALYSGTAPGKWPLWKDLPDRVSPLTPAFLSQACVCDILESCFFPPVFKCELKIFLCSFSLQILTDANCAIHGASKSSSVHTGPAVFMLPIKGITFLNYTGSEMISDSCELQKKGSIVQRTAFNIEKPLLNFWLPSMANINWP